MSIYTNINQLEIQQARRRPAVDTDDPQPTVTDTPEPTEPTGVTTASASTSVITRDLFEDDHWTVEVTDVQVEELDGTWRDVALFRSKLDQERVCLWFGQDEYEGLDPDRPYRYCLRSETLEDDEGFDINWRIKGVENDDEDDEEDEEYHDSFLFLVFVYFCIIYFMYVFV